MDGAKFVQYVIRVLLVIAALALIAMMAIITINVLGRMFLKSPIFGALEIAGLAGIVLSSIAIPYVEKERRNVLVEILVDKLPPRVKGFTDAFVLLLSLGVVVVLSYAMIKESLHAASFGEETLVLQLPTTPFKFIWSIGTLLLCVVLLLNIILSIRKGVKR
jgi:TRAP-type C4-dicarboxylate transport system permease small subunit